MLPLALFSLVFAAEGEAQGRLCLDARARGELRAPSLPRSGDFAFRVDDGAWVRVREGEGVWLSGIAPAGQHRLTIRRGDRPYETLRFSFDESLTLRVRRNHYGFFTFAPMPASAAECPGR